MNATGERDILFCMKKILALIAVVLLVVFGAYMVWRETAHAPAPLTSGQEYTSESISFVYGDAYALTSRSDSFEGNPVTVLNITDKDVIIPDYSEGPVSMAVLAVKNPSETALEAWVKTKSISNFELSMDKNLTATTVGGKPGLAYTYSGLYENDAVAVAHDGAVYLFFVSWIDAESPMRADFQTLLKSVTFK